VYGRGQRRLNAAERSCQLAQPGFKIDASLAHRAAPASWARRTMLPIGTSAKSGTRGGGTVFELMR
jgi:hypothetical protein